MSYAYNIRNIFTGPAGRAEQDVAQMLAQSCWACRANPNSHRCECNREPAAKPIAEPVNRYPSPEETPPASDMRKRLVWMTNCSKEMAGFYREAIAELRITHLMFMGSDLGIKARASAPSQRQFVGTEAFWLQGPQGEVLNYSDCVYLHPTINSGTCRRAVPARRTFFFFGVLIFSRALRRTPPLACLLRER